jgi:hypothetical protein
MTSPVVEMNGTLEAVAALAPVIAARSDEIEGGRRSPPDLEEELTAAGCFRTLVPRSHGGAEFDLPVRDAGDRGAGPDGRLRRVDGDDRIAGTGAAGEAATGDIRRPVRRGPGRHPRWHDQAVGRGHPVDGGFRVTGQWSFASGSQYADWFVAHCIVDDGRQPRRRPAGPRRNACRSRSPRDQGCQPSKARTVSGAPVKWCGHSLADRPGGNDSGVPSSCSATRTTSNSNCSTTHQHLRAGPRAGRRQRSSNQVRTPDPRNGGPVQRVQSMLRAPNEINHRKEPPPWLTQ